MKQITVSVGLFWALLTMLQSSSSQVMFGELGLASNWFDGAIPYVQSYTHYSPVGVFFAYILTNMPEGIAAFTYTCLAAITFWVYLLIFQRKISKNDMVLVSLVFVSLWFGSSLSQRHLYTHLLTLLFTLLGVFFYKQWHKSKKSYWLLGQTQRNWRYLVISGISLSISAFIEPWGVVVLGAVTIHALKTKRKRENYWTLLAILIAPLMAHAWIWISYFVSRGVLTEALSAYWLHLQYLHRGGLYHVNVLASLGIVLLIVALLPYAAKEQFRVARSRWVYSIVAIIGLTLGISRFGWLLPLMLVVYPLIYTPLPIRKRYGKFLLACNAVFVAAVLLYTNNVLLENKLVNVQNNIAKNYIRTNQDLPYITLYIGKSSNFYDTDFPASTRFFDMNILNFDSTELAFTTAFRGDNEAVMPLHIVVAKNELQIAKNSRLEDYLSTHYRLTYSDEFHSIYKRVTNI